MTESIVTNYKRLFEVRILHHYWLDDANIQFDSMSETLRNKKLLAYNSMDFLKIKSSSETEALLKGLKAVAKQTNLGLVVVVPQDMTIPEDAQFIFTIEITNASFITYSSLTLQDRNIINCYSPGEDRIYRYKANVPVFSNLTGVPRGSGQQKQLFLSREFPGSDSGDEVEYLIATGNNLLQLTGSQPGAGTMVLSSDASTMPVYYHQADSPVIIPPAGLNGAPTRGIELNDDIPDNIFAIISISAIKPGDNDYSCISGGQAKVPCPVFQIRFKNRSVIWKYLNKNTGAPVSESSNPLPLTFSGNPGSKQKPSTGIIKAEFEGGVPSGRIERIFTEIFE